MEAFLLGLSSGGTCLVNCLPVTMPVFFARTDNTRTNATGLILFLIGRLIGYIGVGVILGAAGAFTAGYMSPVLTNKIRTLTYILIGILLIGEGFYHIFPNRSWCSLAGKYLNTPYGFLAYGLLSGLKPCPPFFAAAAKVFAADANALSGAMYFFTFFIGTTIFFIPFLFVPALSRRSAALQTVFRITMILMGFYFLIFLGLFSLLI